MPILLRAQSHPHRGHQKAEGRSGSVQSDDPERDFGKTFS